MQSAGVRVIHKTSPERMTTQHYDDDALLAFLDEDRDLLDLDAARAHITACERCSSRLDSVRNWENLLRDPEMWAGVGTDSRHHGRLDEASTNPAIATLVKELEHDARAFREVMSRLNGKRVSAWSDALRDMQPTAAVARSVVTAARERLNTAPLETLAALAVAERILDRVAPRARTVEGDLWRERSNAFRLLGDFPSTLDALDQAEKRYDAAAAFDRALVDWGRGTVYFDMKQFPQARAALQRATATFAEYGDAYRVAQVQITMGGVFFEEGKIESARAAFALSEPTFSMRSDRETLARVWSNLASCDIRLGDVASAQEYVAKASALFDALNMEGEAVRLLWSLGESLIALGRIDAALRYINDAAARFEKLGMIGGAISARCDTLAVLLDRGDLQAAADIAAQAASYFIRVGADADAANALDYLRRATAAARATRPLVEHVRTFVSARLRGEPAAFEPEMFQAPN